MFQDNIIKKNYNSVMKQLLQFNLYNKNREVICFAKDAILENRWIYRNLKNDVIIKF